MGKTNGILKKFGLELTGDEKEPYFYISNKKMLEHLK